MLLLWIITKDKSIWTQVHCGATETGSKSIIEGEFIYHLCFVVLSILHHCQSNRRNQGRKTKITDINVSSAKNTTQFMLTQNVKLVNRSYSFQFGCNWVLKHGKSLETLSFRDQFSLLARYLLAYILLACRLFISTLNNHILGPSIQHHTKT